MNNDFVKSILDNPYIITGLRMAKRLICLIFCLNTDISVRIDG